MHHAAVCGSLPAVRVLLEAGADLALVDEVRAPCRLVGLRVGVGHTRCSPQEGMLPRGRAAAGGYEDVVKHIVGCCSSCTPACWHRWGLPRRKLTRGCEHAVTRIVTARCCRGAVQDTFLWSRYNESALDAATVVDDVKGARELIRRAPLSINALVRRARRAGIQGPGASDKHYVRARCSERNLGTRLRAGPFTAAAACTVASARCGGRLRCRRNTVPCSTSLQRTAASAWFGCCLTVALLTLSPMMYGR